MVYNDLPCLLLLFQQTNLTQDRSGRILGLGREEHRAARAAPGPTGAAPTRGIRGLTRTQPSRARGVLGVGTVEGGRAELLGAGAAGRSEAETFEFE